MSIHADLKSALYEHDGTAINVVDDYLVYPANRLYVEHYLAGRCHIFAMALHNQIGLELGAFLDLEAWVDGLDDPIVALEHAFCIIDDEHAIDARGIRLISELHDEFCESSGEPHFIRGDAVAQQISQWLIEETVALPLPGESQVLQEYIEAMRQAKLLQLGVPADFKPTRQAKTLGAAWSW